MPSDRAHRAAGAVGAHDVAGADPGAPRRMPSRMRAATPSAPALERDQLGAAHERAGPREPAWSSSTRSRWSCGTHAGAVGLISAAWARLGRPTSTPWPSLAPAEGVAQPEQPVHIDAARQHAVRSPQPRSISIVRVLIVVARGCPEGSRRRSTTRLPTPCRARAAAVDEPGRPRPDDEHGDLHLVHLRSSFHTTALSLAGHSVFCRT